MKASVGPRVVTLSREVAALRLSTATLCFVCNVRPPPPPPPQLRPHAHAAMQDNIVIIAEDSDASAIEGADPKAADDPGALFHAAVSK